MPKGPKRKIVRTANHDGMYVDLVLSCGHTTTRRHRYADNQDSCFCSECLDNPDAQAEELGTVEQPRLRIYEDQ